MDGAIDLVRAAVGIFVLLLLFLMPGAAPSFAQAASAKLDATQSNQPTNPPVSAANGVTPPIGIGPHICASFYPPIAVRLNQQGTTIVDVHVTATGTVADVAIRGSSGHGALDAASVKCVMAWTYRPATQNGTPVDAHVENAIRWMLGGRVYGPFKPAIPFVPAGPPDGWEPQNSSPYPAGIIISYKLSQPPAAEQYLSAAAYWKFPDLNAFVAKNDANLQSVNGLRVLREGSTTLCEPASDIEYFQSGLLHDNPNRILDIEQVRTVKDGWAYVATYIRPAESPQRPDAEQWIHNCTPVRGNSGQPAASPARL